MRSQHLSCRARQAYRLLATCLLVLGGSMTQASAVLTMATQNFRSLQEAPIRGEWPGGTVTASFERVENTLIKWLEGNEPKEMVAQGASLLTIEVRMHWQNRWKAAFWGTEQAAWDNYGGMASQAWIALWQAIENREKELRQFISNTIQEIELDGTPKLPADITDLIVAYTPLLSDNSPIYFFQLLSTGHLWDEETLFQKDRPEVLITGGAPEEFLLARTMQKQYFSMEPIQALQKKVTENHSFTKNWQAYMRQMSPDTKMTEAHVREVSRGRPSEIFYECMPFLVYFPFPYADIAKPVGKELVVCFAPLIGPEKALVLPAKAVGRRRAYLISAAQSFAQLAKPMGGFVLVPGLLTVYSAFALVQAVIIAIDSLQKQFLSPPAGRGKTFFQTFAIHLIMRSSLLWRYEVTREVISTAVLAAAGGLLATICQADHADLPRMARTAWWLAGLATIFLLGQSVWELISCYKKPAQKHPSHKRIPYSRRYPSIGLFLRKLRGAGAICIVYLVFRSLLVHSRPFPALRLIVLARPVWLYQYVQACRIPLQTSNPDVVVRLGVLLGLCEWMLIAMIFSLFIRLVNRYAGKGYLSRVKASLPPAKRLHI